MRGFESAHQARVCTHVEDVDCQADANGAADELEDLAHRQLLPLAEQGERESERERTREDVS